MPTHANHGKSALIGRGGTRPQAHAVGLHSVTPFGGCCLGGLGHSPGLRHGATLYHPLRGLRVEGWAAFPRLAPWGYILSPPSGVISHVCRPPLHSCPCGVKRPKPNWWCPSAWTGTWIEGQRATRAWKPLRVRGLLPFSCLSLIHMGTHEGIGDRLRELGRCQGLSTTGFGAEAVWSTGRDKSRPIRINLRKGRSQMRATGGRFSLEKRAEGIPGRGGRARWHPQGVPLRAFLPFDPP